MIFKPCPALQGDAFLINAWTLQHLLIFAYSLPSHHHDMQNKLMRQQNSAVPRQRPPRTTAFMCGAYHSNSELTFELTHSHSQPGAQAASSLLTHTHTLLCQGCTRHTVSFSCWKWLPTPQQHEVLSSSSVLNPQASRPQDVQAQLTHCSEFYPPRLQRFSCNNLLLFFPFEYFFRPCTLTSNKATNASLPSSDHPRYQLGPQSSTSATLSGSASNWHAQHRH
jgi:predicted Fe-S protein YdhL (DUF1289 family)